jgi:hypothetical protein
VACPVESSREKVHKFSTKNQNDSKLFKKNGNFSFGHFDGVIQPTVTVETVESVVTSTQFFVTNFSLKMERKLLLIHCFLKNINERVYFRGPPNAVVCFRSLREEKDIGSILGEDVIPPQWFFFGGGGVRPLALRSFIDFRQHGTADEELGFRSVDVALSSITAGFLQCLARAQQSN